MLACFHFSGSQIDQMLLAQALAMYVCLLKYSLYALVKATAMLCLESFITEKQPLNAVWTEIEILVDIDV